MDNLVERVAKGLCAAEDARWDAQNFNETPGGETPAEMRDRFRELARAIIPIVMEEAAKLCDAERLEEPQPGTSDEGYEQALTDAAESIRTRSSEIAGLSKESE